MNILLFIELCRCFYLINEITVGFEFFKGSYLSHYCMSGFMIISVFVAFIVKSNFLPYACEELSLGYT